MPTPLVASDHHLGHDGLVELVAGRPIPCYEAPERATAIREALLATGSYELVAPTDHGPDPIAAVHAMEIIDLVEHAWTDAVAAGRDPAQPLLPDTFLLREYAAGMALERTPLGRHDRLGAYCFDTATPIVAGTAAAARAAVDIALTTLDLVLAGEPLAYALCRPPGHHAYADRATGFCFLNNAAIAAEILRQFMPRVAVIDFDTHHGDGTQALFYARDDVFYGSVHTDPADYYPFYSGYADEIGTGPGQGANMNVPLAPGANDAAFVTANERLAAAVRAHGVGALVLSAGWDAHRDDPLSRLDITTAAFARIGALWGRMRLPTLIVQEGGYSLSAVMEAAPAFIAAFRAG
jgi:acetoin utilization deacetylase AcuC-like enzyme